MTTIVYKADQLVADRQITREGLPLQCQRKLYSNDLLAFGVAGDAEAVETVMGCAKSLWDEIDNVDAQGFLFALGDRMRESPVAGAEFEILAVAHGARTAFWMGDVGVPVYLGQRSFAIGTGAAYALGAMEANPHADATLALRIASKFDVFTGQHQDIETVEGA